MAIVKANFVKRGAGERARAKATIRYIADRPGKDRKKPEGSYLDLTAGLPKSRPAV
jgi:hypothetical protein